MSYARLPIVHSLKKIWVVGITLTVLIAFKDSRYISFWGQIRESENLSLNLLTENEQASLSKRKIQLLSKKNRCDERQKGSFLGMGREQTFSTEEFSF